MIQFQRSCVRKCSRLSSSVYVTCRYFGASTMRAWIKRQEKAKSDKKRDTQELKKEQFKVCKQWQPNELYDNNPLIPIKVPNIDQLLKYDSNADKSEHMIRSAVNAIEDQNESDIDAHEYHIYSLFVIERLPIVNRVFEHQEEYRSCLRSVKLQQSMPNLFKDLYIDHIQKQDRERQKNLKIRPRITINDDNNEYHSLNRWLDRRLYLLCKQRNKDKWEFPWTHRQFDETLLETANRALVERIGPYLHYSTVTGEPFGHTQYEYGTEHSPVYSNGKKGAQLYFQKGYYVKGNGRPNINESVEDFGWFPKEEVEQKLNLVLWKSLKTLLLE